jgi:diguanylate cyclase (GGDEF)-like protein
VFWKRKPAGKQPAPADDTRTSGRPAAEDAVGEAALDTLVAIVRAFGRHAFEIAGIDMATFQRRCDAWAQHLVVGAPHPDAGPDGATSFERGERDFLGARQFVVQRRQDECSFLSESLSDLREVVADLTERFGTTLGQDNEAASRIAEQVERLRNATATTSLVALRQEVQSVAQTLSTLAEAHQQRVRGQLVELDLKVATLSEELHELKHESSLDALTRVFNRGAFDRTFRRLHRVNSVSAQASTLLMTDLDNLKRINEMYGHQSGDEALRVFADCLVRNFPRRSDFIARYGGDEFVAVLPQTPGPQCERLVKRFMDTVRRLQVTRDEQSFRITASVGVAELRKGEDPESWLERADRVLLEAKTLGRDMVVVAP